jgi:protein-tyrosine phosphatase
LIDLHCHLLPGVDDGAPDLATSLAMARMAVADGVRHVACTPHITPGVYNNTGSDIEERIDSLSSVLEAEGIALNLWRGADVHVDPQLVDRLTRGEVPTLGQSRYFLLEPPHHVVPPRLPALVQDLVAASYVPIITHPERLGWIESHYDMIVRLVAMGALIQLTAASITGGFGKRPKYWSERMLDQGIVDIIATDAHNTTGRPPILSVARDVLAERLGEAEAIEMVHNRPARVLRDELMPARTKEIPPQVDAKDAESSGWARGLFKKLRGK